MKIMIREKAVWICVFAGALLLLFQYIVYQHMTDYRSARFHLQKLGYFVDPHPHSQLHSPVYSTAGLDDVSIRGYSDQIDPNSSFADIAPHIKAIRKHVVVLKLPRQIVVSKNEISLILALGNLRSLHFLGPEIVDDDFRKLGNLSHLTKLHAQVPLVTDDGCQWLDTMGSLSDVTIIHASITDSTFKLLDAKGLDRIDVSFTDVALGFSKKNVYIDSLKVLLANNSLVSDNSIHFVDCFPNVWLLSLKQTSVGDNLSLHFCKMSALEYLHLDEAKVSSRGVRGILETCTNLRCLSLDGNSVDDSAFQDLQNWPPHLESMSLQGTHVTNHKIYQLMLLHPDLYIEPNHAAPDKQVIEKIKALARGKRARKSSD